MLRKTFESLLDCKEIKPVNPKGNHWKDWCWSSNTLATSWEELAHWKRPWCWGKLKVGKEGGDRGWDGWMASLTRWTWIWASSGSWWWTGKPGVLQSMVLQRVRYDWVTELNWTEHSIQCLLFLHVTVILTSWFSLSYGKWNSHSFFPYSTSHSFALSHLLCGLPWCFSVKESAY